MNNKMKSPVKDIDVGIPPNDWNDSLTKKYRDVRHKAINEYKECKHKSKKNKEVKVPRYKPGDIVVASSGLKTRDYFLIELIDFDFDNRSMDEYFGILRKTTDSSYYNRIGRLITCGERAWRMNIIPNITDKDIKWFENV